MKVKDYDQAIEWFEKAIAINPIPNSYNDMGVAYFYKEEKEKAEASFKKAIELDPNHLPAYHSLGLFYLKQERLEEAYQVWQRALKLDPNNQEIKRNLILLEQSRQTSP